MRSVPLVSVSHVSYVMTPVLLNFYVHALLPWFGSEIETLIIIIVLLFVCVADIQRNSSFLTIKAGFHQGYRFTNLINVK